jgi:hypothetical protein
MWRRQKPSRDFEIQVYWISQSQRSRSMECKTFALSILIVLPVTILGSCGSNTVTMQYDTSLHSVLLRVQSKEVIRFVDANNKKFVPTFPLGSPCTDDNDLKKGTCTVSATAPLNKYPFSRCEACPDPEIVVGSDTQPIDPNVKASRSATAGDPVPVFMGCVNGATVLVPPETKEHKSDEITIEWVPGGSNPLKDWTVSDFKDPAGGSAVICKQSPPFNKDITDCTVDQSKVTAGTTYTYAVSSSSCAAGLGKITILPAN